jgi:Zn finger protein HypA/HybF involved in hydrogenase expression
VNDAILCCDVCFKLKGYPVPLEADGPSGCAWCPQCGKQWEEISEGKEVEVKPPEAP